MADERLIGMRERLKERAGRLRFTGELIAQYVEDSAMRDDVTDQENRLMAINNFERTMLTSTGLRRVVSDITLKASRGDYLSPGDKMWILGRFSQGREGDPLCSRVSQYLTYLRYGERKLGEVQELYHLGLDFLRRLVTRTISEPEYNGLLTGEIPIGTVNGIKHYLPQGEIQTRFPENSSARFVQSA